jgi:hypothetical protein
VHNKAGSLALALCVALAAALAAAAVARARQDAHTASGFSGAALTAFSARHRAPVNPRLTRRFRQTAWHWESVMGRKRTRFASPLHTRRALAFWRTHAGRVRRQAGRPPHRFGWLCIHRYEGSWSDFGEPYWGGLQMDRSFMLRYAPAALLRRGWANRWSALEQMWVAERAYRSGRGFYPWPHTAQVCGLI